MIQEIYLAKTIRCSWFNTLFIHLLFRAAYWRRNGAKRAMDPVLHIPARTSAQCSSSPDLSRVRLGALGTTPGLLFQKQHLLIWLLCHKVAGFTLPRAAGNEVEAVPAHTHWMWTGVFLTWPPGPGYCTPSLCAMALTQHFGAAPFGSEIQILKPVSKRYLLI